MFPLSLKEGATFFLPNTEGVEIHKTVEPIDGETIIEKHFPNSFLQTDLLSRLKSKEVKELVICGMMTHMYIDATVRAAKELGFGCTLIEDACTTKDLSYSDQFVPAKQVHYSFIGALNGAYATVKNTREYLSHLK